MQVLINKSGNSAEIELSEKFTFSDNLIFKDILNLAEEPDITSITLNVHKLEYADSSALGMLMLLIDAAKKRNFTVSIRGLGGQIEKLLKISKIDSFFNIIG